VFRVGPAERLEPQRGGCGDAGVPVEDARQERRVTPSRSAACVIVQPSASMALATSLPGWAGYFVRVILEAVAA